MRGLLSRSSWGTLVAALGLISLTLLLASCGEYGHPTTLSSNRPQSYTLGGACQNSNLPSKLIIKRTTAGGAGVADIKTTSTDRSRIRALEQTICGLSSDKTAAKSCLKTTTVMYSLDFESARGHVLSATAQAGGCRLLFYQHQINDAHAYKTTKTFRKRLGHFVSVTG